MSFEEKKPPDSPDKTAQTGEAPPRRSCRGRIFSRLLLLAASGALALLLAEAAIRLMLPQPLAAIVYAHDARFGFWNLARLNGKKIQSEPNAPPYRVTTDANGYRGSRPVLSPKPAGVFRIVALGDSFTYGVGVEDEDTFPAQIEKFLNAPPLPLETSLRRVEVVNAGCPGWGTENALAFWRARADELDPDLLLIAFYRNDLDDNMRHLVYRVSDGAILHEPDKKLPRIKRLTRAIPFYAFLCEHSHLVNLLRRMGADQLTRPKHHPPRNEPLPAAQNPDPASPDRPNSPDSAALARKMEVYTRLAEALLDDAKAREIPTILALLPDRNDCWDMPPAGFSEAARAADAWEAAGKTRAANLRAPVKAALEQGANLFLPGDGHYTQEGNRLVAEKLAEKIRRTLPAHE